MKRKLTKILASLLCVVMIITAAPVSGFVGIEIPWLSDLSGIEASAASYSGTCGDNLIWSLDTKTGVLDITGTGDMTNWQYPSSAPWYSYCSYIKFVNIGNSVTSIGKCAFGSCRNLISVTIGNSVTSIGGYAFYDCGKLTSVTIGNSVTSISDHAFYLCDSLERITVDTNNKYYSNDEYGVLFNKDKTTLIQYPKGNTRTTYTIPDSVTSIGNYAFDGCDRLTSVTIPDSVTSIGNYAFDWCDSLTSVTIGNSVASIGNRAFYNCDSLISITIPDSVTSIGNYAFEDCDRLASVTIPDSVTSIGEKVFIFCDSLTSVTIGNSVTSIGNYAFSNCDSLERITVDINNKYYSNDEYGVLFNKDKTTLIQYPNGNTRTTYTIPDSVTRIGEFAFSDSESLTSVTIGNSVTSIGELAFSDCESLTSVTIAYSVKSIGDYAFSNCDSLTDVYYFGTEDQWNKIRIGYRNELLTNATIHFNSPGKDFHPHSYTSTVTKEATCSATGVKTYVCSCGDTYSKEIPVADHSLTHETVAPTCKAQGYEYDYCSSCKGSFNKVYLPTVEHSWGEWKVIVEPTMEDEGVKTRECSVCHDIETVTIPILKEVSKVTIDDFVVKYKDPYKLTPKVEADEGVEYEITYTSSNPEVVTVDKDGNVITKGRGIATIFCTVTDEFGNEVKDTCNVVVKLNWWQWIIWILLFGWAWY